MANKGTVKPKVRLIKSCNKGFRLIKGFNCFGTEVTNVKTNLLTNDESHIAVSYTHLRAHETLRHLVCRLLLEKKKK